PDAGRRPQSPRAPHSPPGSSSRSRVRAARAARWEAMGPSLAGAPSQGHAPRESGDGTVCTDRRQSRSTSTQEREEEDRGGRACTCPRLRLVLRRPHGEWRHRERGKGRRKRRPCRAAAVVSRHASVLGRTSPSVRRDLRPRQPPVPVAEPTTRCARLGPRPATVGPTPDCKLDWLDLVQT
ncbi:unnamed protein product, partial [Ixodes pacificus]